MTLDRSTLFIDGSWAAPTGSDRIEVVSPHTEEVVARVPEGTPADIDAAVDAARRAFDSGPWPRMSPEERIEVVQNFANLYAGKLGEMAEVITTEMGSPTSFSNLAQSPAPWMMIESFINIAKAFPWEEIRAWRARAATSSSGASRSASWPRSRRGTSRSSRRSRSSPRRCWPAAPSSSSRRPRPRSTPT